ncbi:MAG: DUF4344 domain-containing metallopeptidase [Granulosicoccaceae bacterium]
MTCQLKALALALFLLPSTLWANFEVRWQTPQSGSEELYAGALRDSNIVKDAFKLGKRPFKWPATLTFMMGGSGTPRYDPTNATITIPYSYLAEAVQGQSHFEESRATALQRGLDVVEYTLYHLLGHALLDSHDVDQDETAESLATWLMVTSTSNGGEQWLEDVEAFSRASQKLDGPLEDYWHSHGLSKRSMQRLNCLVVGSGPTLYLQRFPGLVESPAQTAACETQWQTLRAMVQQEYTRAQP